MKWLFNIFFGLILFTANAQQPPAYKSINDTSFIKGDKILAPVIIFHDSRIGNTAHDSIAKIAAFLVSHPTYEVEIGFFTDFRGSDVYNKKYSTAQANTVVNYLEKKFGIPLKQIVPYGYGETKLIYNEQDVMKESDSAVKEKMMQQNRRCEIKILDTAYTSATKK
ncbi:MAG TPA: OmpA family protein [Flavobacteriales bacterium]|nr:OmpA family protein [Flavobacteriales bacterium]